VTLAAFHAAQALIAERVGKSAKTHRARTSHSLDSSETSRPSISSCGNSCRNPSA
jgi:hypothetical protein